MELLKELFNYLLANYALYLVVMMGVIIALTNTLLMFLKKPIKLLTCKIKNNKARKLANKVLILIAFGISAGAWYVLNKVSNYYFPFDEIKVLLTGAFSTVIYALGDGVVTKSQANELVENIKDIAKDGKIDNKDKHAVADFWNKVK